MEVKFKVYETPQPKGRKGESLSHARVQTRGTKQIEDICKYINEVSSLSPADIKGSLEALIQYVSISLCDGYNVELEGLGHLSLSLRTQQIENEAEEVVNQVSVDSVNFRPSERLRCEVKKTNLRRVRPVRPVQTLEERKERMVDYLQWKGSINLTNYALLNSLSRYKAGKDIEQFLEEGLLVKSGTGTHQVFLLSNNWHGRIFKGIL
ncbi:DNA-binding protein [Parabacteroides sp. OttesenSCG-928-G07]|nr:DNA-binding protein [Parabacteroides sp. OttesenSCG-928-G07]